MSNNFISIDNAMNLIKENLVRDLSESVIRKSKNSSNFLANFSFSEKKKD